MPTDDEYEADPDIASAVDQLAMAELGKAIHGAHEDSDPYKRRARAAAIEVCRRAGILDALKAISADGELRPPPPWPQADIVPVGGGPGWLLTRIRTAYDGRVVATEERIKVKGKPTQNDIGNAYDRGYWRLNREIKKGAR
jgi:hypothetical protein